MTVTRLQKWTVNLISPGAQCISTEKLPNPYIKEKAKNRKAKDCFPPVFSFCFLGESWKFNGERLFFSVFSLMLQVVFPKTYEVLKTSQV